MRVILFLLSLCLSAGAQVVRQTPGPITDGGVTTSKLADGSVTTPKLADAAVTSAKLSNTLTSTMTFASDVKVEGVLRVDPSANIIGDSANPVLRLSNSAGALLGYGTSSVTVTGAAIQAIIGNAEIARFSSVGVGVGNVLPGAKLHVSSGGVILDGNAATPLTVGISTFVIQSGGNVGIGTASPCSTCTLHVAGGASVSGGLTADGSVTASSVTISGYNIAGTWYTFTPSWTGFSSTPPASGFFTRIGKTVILQIKNANNGTSDNTSHTIVLPVAGSAARAQSSFGSVVCTDNGSAVTVSRVSVGANSTTGTFFFGVGSTGFTASGASYCEGTVIYESN